MNNNNQFYEILPIIFMILAVSMYMYKDEKVPEVDNSVIESEEDMYSDIASVREYEDKNNVEVVIDNNGYENIVKENGRYKIINGFTYISTSYDDRTMYLDIRELFDENDSILVTGFTYTPQNTLVEEMCFSNIFEYSDHQYISKDGTMVLVIDNGKVTITESVHEDGSNSDYLFTGEFYKINENVNSIIPYLSAEELSEVINNDQNIGNSYSFKVIITGIDNGTTYIQVENSELNIIGHIDDSISELINHDTVIVSGIYSGIEDNVPVFDIKEIKVVN